MEIDYTNGNQKVHECHQCGVLFKAYRRKHLRGKNYRYTFCKTKCYHKYLKEVQREHARAKAVVVKCTSCGKELVKQPGRLREIRKGKILVYKNHFCNKKCQREWNLWGNWKKINPEDKWVIVKCEGCGIQFLKLADRIGSSNFHNHECYVDNMKKQKGLYLSPQKESASFAERSKNVIDINVFTGRRASSNKIYYRSKLEKLNIERRLQIGEFTPRPEEMGSTIQRDNG